MHITLQQKRKSSLIPFGTQISVISSSIKEEDEGDFEGRESRETSIDSTNSFLDRRFDGHSLVSTSLHHSGTTVIEIPEEDENQGIEMPITPLALTNALVPGEVLIS